MKHRTSFIATIAAVTGLALGGLSGVAVAHRSATHDAAAPASQERPEYAPCTDIGRPTDLQGLLGDHWPTASHCDLMGLADRLAPEQSQWVVDAAASIESARRSMSSLVLYVGMSPEELGSDKPMSPNEARTAIQQVAEHLDAKLRGDAMRLFGFSGPGLPEKPDYILVPTSEIIHHLG